MSGDFSDRRRILGWFAGGGIVVAATAATVTVPSRGAAEEKVKLENVPKDVRDAADAYVAAHIKKLKVEWASEVIKLEEDEPIAGKKKPQKKVAYEFDGVRGKGFELTVVVTDNGKVIEVEKEIKPANVPAGVLAAVTGRWPNFAATKVYEIQQSKDMLAAKPNIDTVYDLRGAVGKQGNREFHVQVSDKGDIVEWTVEIAVAKVPAVVTNALMAKRPKFQVVTAFELHENKAGKNEIIGYNFEGNGPKRAITISVSPDGKHVEVAE